MLLHLALAGEWDAARSAGQPYRRSTLGVSLDQQGFVHCSFPDQVAAVADAVYAGRDDVVLLAIDPERLTAPVKVEAAGPSQPERFPHVYGPLDLDAVVAAVPVPLRPGGRLDVERALAAAGVPAGTRLSRGGGD